jgi:hypothetical protein
VPFSDASRNPLLLRSPGLETLRFITPLGEFYGTAKPVELTGAEFDILLLRAELVGELALAEEQVATLGWNSPGPPT